MTLRSLAESIGDSNGLFHRQRRPCPLPGRAPPPTARRGWEYSLDAMSAAGRGQAQPGRDERCWNASLDAMSIAVRDTAYTWVVSSLACPQIFWVPVAS